MALVVLFLINMKKFFLKAVKIVSILFLVLLVLGYKGNTYMISPLGDGKVVTIYRSLFYFYDHKVYVVPYKYYSLFPPRNSFVSFVPHYEPKLFVNWKPENGRILKIGIPRSIEPATLKMDTAKYEIKYDCLDNCILNAGDSTSDKKYTKYDFTYDLLL